MKIVIIGGNGFVGTALTELLSKENHELVVIDPTPSETKLNGVQYCECNLLEIERTLGFIMGASVIVFSALPSFTEYEQAKDLNNLQSGIFVQYLANLVALTGASLITLSDWHVYGRILGQGGEDTQPKPNSDFASYLNYFENMVRTMIPESVVMRLGDVWSYDREPMGIINSIAYEVARMGYFSRLDDEFSYFPYVTLDDVTKAVREVILQNPTAVTLNCYESSTRLFDFYETLNFKSKTFSGYLDSSVDMRGIKFYSLYQPSTKFSEGALLDLVGRYKEDL